MRTRVTPEGPFAESVYYTDQEIEDACADELRRVDLLPSSPQPVRIDRFIEKRFRVIPTYKELPDGVLGFSRFGKSGVVEVVIAAALADENSVMADRRLRSTIAHEGGHAILQIHLFALDPPIGPRLIQDNVDVKQRKVLCRTEVSTKKYDGRWWEVQANKAIGALLLPRHLVNQVLLPIVVERGALGNRTLADEKRPAAVDVLVDTFDVNASVAKIRLDQLFPISNSAQLTL